MRTISSKSFSLAMLVLAFSSPLTSFAQGLAGVGPGPDPNPKQAVTSELPKPKQTMNVMPEMPAFEQLQKAAFPQQYVNNAKAEDLNKAQVLSKTFIEIVADKHFSLVGKTYSETQTKVQAFRNKWLPRLKDIKTLEQADDLNEEIFDSLGQRFDYYFRPAETEAEAKETNPTFVGIGARIEHVGEDLLLDAIEPPGEKATDAEIEAIKKAVEKCTVVDDEHPLILHPYKNSPASAAGVLDGDILRKVDGKDVKGMTTKEIIEKIKGKENTKVELTVERTVTTFFGMTVPAEKHEVKVTVTRMPFAAPSVTSKYLGDGVTMITLDTFMSQFAEQEMYEALQEAMKQKNPKIILNLRNNPGGRLDLAIKVVGFFLHKGEIVRLRQREGNEMINIHHTASPDALIATQQTPWDSSRINYHAFQHVQPVPDNVPVAVLINGMSASASELTSGALKFNRRAVIVGETSLGKGVGQQVIPLPENRSCHVTTFYFDPAERIIDFEGVHPSDGYTRTLEAEYKQLKDLQVEYRKNLKELAAAQDSLVKNPTTISAAETELGVKTVLASHAAKTLTDATAAKADADANATKAAELVEAAKKAKAEAEAAVAGVAAGDQAAKDAADANLAKAAKALTDAEAAKATADQTASGADKALTAAKDNATKVDAEVAAATKAVADAKAAAPTLTAKIAELKTAIEAVKAKLVAHRTMLRENDPQQELAKKAVIAEGERMTKETTEADALRKKTIEEKQKLWDQRKKDRDEARKARAKKAEKAAG